MSAWLQCVGLWGALVLACAAQGQEDLLPDPARPLKLPMSEVCFLTIDEGKLCVNTRLQGMRLIAQPVEAAELPGTTSLTLRPRYLRLEHAYPAEGSLAGMTFRVSSRSSEDRIEVNTRDYNAEFRQTEHGGVRLSVYDSSYASVHNLTADDFETLKRENPAAVIQFMGPVFKALKMPGMFGVDEQLAKRVLMEGKPLGQVRPVVEKLVGDLGAAEFQKRRQAARKLREMGQDAFAAMEKLDRWQLTPHQLTEVDAILKEARGISAEQVSRLGKDPAFLLDSCYCEDEAVRVEAVRRLRGLASAGAVSIDPKAEPLSQAPAIERLRSALVKPPPTRPMDEPPDDD